MRERVSQDRLVEMMNEALRKSDICDEDVEIRPRLQRMQEPVEFGPNWRQRVSVWPKSSDPTCVKVIRNIVDALAAKYDVDWGM